MKFADLQSMTDEQLQAAKDDIIHELNERRTSKINQALENFLRAAQELYNACDSYAFFEFRDSEGFAQTYGVKEFTRHNFIH